MRLKNIDGLRGLAILSVILYHAYSRWIDYLPWLEKYKNVKIFQYGYLGVELFFIISGYVILLTLENSKSFTEFLFRRWVRLFPGMLIATTLIYVSADWLYERPYGYPALLDILPGLLFIESGIINRIVSEYTVSPIEGSFWSLFVEVKFYIIFGILYFHEKKNSLSYLVLIYVFSFAVWITSSLMDLEKNILNRVLNELFSLKYFGWLSFGALIYNFQKTNEWKFLGVGIIMVVLSLISGNDNSQYFYVAGALVPMLFMASLFLDPARKIFESNILLKLGFVSYPLYLIHENALVALAIKTHVQFPQIPDWLTPWPGLIAIGLMSYVIAKYGEPFVRKLGKILISGKLL